MPPSCGYRVEPVAVTNGKVAPLAPPPLYFHTALLSAPVVAAKLRAAMVAGSRLDFAEPKSDRVSATFLFVIDIAVVVASVYWLSECRSFWLDVQAVAVVGAVA